MSKQAENTFIFVVGNPRSGTTMMGRLLGNHPMIHTFDAELHFFEKLWAPEDRNRQVSLAEATDFAARLACIEHDKFFRQGDPKRFWAKAREVVQGVSANNFSLADIYKTFLKHAAAANGKTIPCEQTQGYVYYLRELLDLFPGAKVINMVRDPRDVLLSQKCRWKIQFAKPQIFRRQTVIRTWMNYHPISTSRLWRAAVRTADKFKDDGRLCSVRFEDLLEHPEKESRKICEFIGVSYYPNMLEVPRTNSSLVPDRPDQKGIDPARTANWKSGGLNPAEIFISQTIAEDTMKKWGYRPARTLPNPLALAFYGGTFPVKLFLTVLLHRKYIKNIREAVKRRLLWASPET